MIEQMIEQSLIHLDLFDPPKSPILSFRTLCKREGFANKRGTLNGSILSPQREALDSSVPPLKRKGRGDQTPFNPQTSSDVKGVGIDIVSISRIAQLIKRYDRHTLTLLFTPGEIDRCQASDDGDRAFAVCFAAKEAVGKALGTGLVDVEWNEIEAVFTLETLAIELYGKADMQAKRNGIQRWLASWHEWNEHILVHTLAL